MVDTSTGLRRVRAGLPEDWHAGDKTGTGLMVNTSGIYVDVGFAQPRKGAPVTFATYFRPAGANNRFDRAHDGGRTFGSGAQIDPVKDHIALTVAQHAKEACGDRFAA